MLSFDRSTRSSGRRFGYRASTTCDNPLTAMQSMLSQVGVTVAETNALVLALQGRGTIPATMVVDLHGASSPEDPTDCAQVHLEIVGPEGSVSLDLPLSPAGQPGARWRDHEHARNAANMYWKAVSGA